MVQVSKETIKEIAEQLDCGFRVFINKYDNNKLLVIPDELKHPDMDTEAWESEMDELDKNFSDYLEINAMESRDSFLIMEEFIDMLENSNKLKPLLIQSLNKKKPFRHFKFIIDNSGIYRQEWFEFKDKKMHEWVTDQLNDLNKQ